MTKYILKKGTRLVIIYSIQKVCLELGQLQKVLQEQLKGLIPADALPKILNLVAYSMLVFILIFGGAKISEIGVKLLNKQ